MPDFMTSQKTIIDQQKRYWDDAAHDPDVAEKYIANVPLEDCLEAIANPLRAGSILDIGCGIGRLTEPLAKAATQSQLHGIDISPEMIELCPDSTVKYVISNGLKIPYADQSFDSVYSMLVFQHIDDVAMERYIRETARVLKRGGVFRFQFIEGDHHDWPVDHNHALDDVKTWLQAAGLIVFTVQKGIVLPEWTWITAVKGAINDRS